MLKFISIALFLVLPLLPGGARAADAALAAPVILVFGDSLSAGYGLAQGQSWPSLLETRLREQRLNYTVVNASISGETTAGGRSRIDAALARAKPAIVIIALGGNDGLRGLPVSAMRANLAAMIDAARARKAQVLLAGMRLPPNYGFEYTRDFEQSYADLAREHQTALTPFLLDGLAERRDLFQADGIHPVAAAQPIILDNVWKALKPRLK